MRILWISPNAGNYKQDPSKCTGGWIGALQKELAKRKDVELGIVFHHNTDKKIVKCDNTTYFPICTNANKNVINRLINTYFFNKVKENNKILELFIQTVYIFKPDIVHFWGLEFDYAELIPLLIGNYKTVVHIQGLTSLCIFTYLPPYVSLKSINKVNSFKDFIILNTSKRDFASIIERSNRELKIAPLVKYWIGRTDWDKKASEMLSPNSKYFHCDEMIRSDFRNHKWHYHYDGNIIHIHSSIGTKWYKGIDVIIKTAYVLKSAGKKFSWRVYGVEENSPYVNYFMELYNRTGIDLGVIFCGYADGMVIKNSLLESDVFVHPSYIENSSNAIAEAMILGVPTIAQYVGGNPSMLKNNSGVLVAPNEPYMMAYEIIKMCDKECAEGYSERAIKVANTRQNGDTIVNDLICIYKEIINDK